MRTFDLHGAIACIQPTKPRLKASLEGRCGAHPFKPSSHGIGTLVHGVPTSKKARCLSASNSLTPNFENTIPIADKSEANIATIIRTNGAIAPLQLNTAPSKGMTTFSQTTPARTIRIHLATALPQLHAFAQYATGTIPTCLHAVVARRTNGPECLYHFHRRD